MDQERFHRVLVVRCTTKQLLLLLWLAAVALCLTGLGNVPLRDWDEGIVARVALESSLTPWPDKWFPSYWGQPYLNKPPGLHWLIAAAIGSWRSLSGAAAAALPPEWVVRLVPALISTTLVPLLGAIQLRLRPGDRGSAIATAAITLSLLPLARHGRLAMLDGCQLVAIALLWWSLLSARAQQRAVLLWGISGGLAVSALLMLKAPVALPILAGSVLLRALDRELTLQHWQVLFLAIGLGMLPGVGWHLAHALARGDAAWQMWGSQGVARLSQSLEGHSGGPLEPLLEVLKGGGPWLLLWPYGIAKALRQRAEPWGRWCLGITLLTAAMVLPLQTQLPWYSLLLWPGFCLCCGPVLAQLVQQPGAHRWAVAGWRWLGLILIAGAAVVWRFGASSLSPLAGSALLVGATLSLAGWQFSQAQARQRLRGAVVLVGGLWLTLLLLMQGPFWLWELNESWSAPSAAQLLHPYGRSSTVLINDEERASLNWYAAERIRSGNNQLRRAIRSQGEVMVLSRTTPSLAGLQCNAKADSRAIQLYHCSGIARETLKKD
jgi:4-amino-4-deoxy-L-arabinose transferase-like glycosyltransferase